MTRQMRSSIRAASGPEQGVGSLPSMPQSPSITTSPEKRRPDPLPLYHSPKQAEGPEPHTHQQTICLLHLRTGRCLLSASLSAKGPEWKVNLHWSACCCVHGPEPQTLLGDISARKGPRKSKALTQESQTHKPLQLLGGQWVLPSHLHLCCAPQVGIDSAHLGSADGTQTLV